MIVLGRYSVYDFPYPQYHSLRLKAVELLENSLLEQNSQLFEAFIEAQLITEPPPLDLLSDLAEDIATRLQMLRGNVPVESMAEARRAHDHKLKTLEYLQNFIADWRQALQALLARRALSQNGFTIPQPVDESTFH